MKKHLKLKYYSENLSIGHVKNILQKIHDHYVIMSGDGLHYALWTESLSREKVNDSMVVILKADHEKPKLEVTILFKL